MIGRLPPILLGAAAVVALDQVTKLIALDRLAPGVPVSLIDGLLALTLVMNPGLAFGLLGGLPAGARWLVAVLSIA
ncbi:MAG: signal peptidase II, partial [Candidatus Rokubacteria bacterium]|nr:signal peptidase II [Candidatus Rokubacteria bacterium]